MHKKIQRPHFRTLINKYRKIFPVVAILGPRQCGKSTLAKDISKTIRLSSYYDLEDFDVIHYINENHAAFFRANKGKTLFLDEVQKLPGIFRTLRGVIDEDRKNGRFFVLGSASSDLLQQTSESLAGRIGYIDLTPFYSEEISQKNLITHWMRGGFPESFLAETDEYSLLWRENFIKSIIEKDVREFKDWNTDYLSSVDLFKLLQLIAHSHGQPINYTKLAAPFGKTGRIIERYINLLEKLYFVRRLSPYYRNSKKRLVKSPKIYLRDSGLLHAVARIKSERELKLHPLYGFSFEGYVIENLSTVFSDWDAFYYRSSNFEEIDFILQKGVKRVAFEIKTSPAPQLSGHNLSVLKSLKLDHAFVVVPSYDTPHVLEYGFGNVTIGTLPQTIETMKKMFA